MDLNHLISRKETLMMLCEDKYTFVSLRLVCKFFKESIDKEDFEFLYWTDEFGTTFRKGLLNSDFYGRACRRGLTYFEEKGELFFYSGDCMPFLNSYAGKEWRKNGLIHREGGKCAVKCRKSSCLETSRLWFEYGVPFRKDNKPHLEISNSEGMVFSWLSILNGRCFIHRNEDSDLPARIKVKKRKDLDFVLNNSDYGLLKSDMIFEKEYMIRGVHHREKGPSIIKKDEDSIMIYYFKEGNLHREGGASIIKFSKSEGILHLRYMINDILHNDKGPAKITRKKGKYLKDKRVWFLRGVLIHKEILCLKYDGDLELEITVKDNDGNYRILVFRVLINLKIYWNDFIDPVLEFYRIAKGMVVEKTTINYTNESFERITESITLTSMIEIPSLE